jgi:hypothetical protein
VPVPRESGHGTGAEKDDDQQQRDRRDMSRDIVS